MKRYIKSAYYDFYTRYNIDIDGGNLRWSIMSPKNPYIYIHGISVDESRQGVGIGTELMDDIIQIANQLGLPIELQVAPIKNKSMTKEQLISWYKKLGFKENITGILRYDPI